jgi:hypothetical protein
MFSNAWGTTLNLQEDVGRLAITQQGKYGFTTEPGHHISKIRDISKKT